MQREVPQAMRQQPNSFLFLVVRPGAPFVESLLLEAMPFATSNFLLLVLQMSYPLALPHFPLSGCRVGDNTGNQHTGPVQVLSNVCKFGIIVDLGFYQTYLGDLCQF